MKKIEKILGHIDMSWKKVIVFAVLTGVYTGVINLIPFLYDTSFQDIAIAYEWWVLFALIIIINCKKPTEASLKTFVFFLISQPLVYLVELPFVGVTIWNYYKFWFVITLLTLPGGFIAYFIKSKNLIGTLVLSVALIIVSISSASYLETVINNFPHHILSFIFCIILNALLIINIIPNNKLKILAVFISLVALTISLYYDTKINNNITVALPDGIGWSCKLEKTDESTINNDDYTLTFIYNSSSVKNNSIICTNSIDEISIYDITINSDKKIVNIIPKNSKG